MKLSIVIPCHNSASTVGAQLEALASQRWSGSWEVLFADNGSTDASRAVAESYASQLPNFRIVDASARRGASFARNEGARHARGESLVFCDADDEVAPGWVEAIGTALARHDFVCSRFKTDKLNPSWKQRYLGEVQSEGLMTAWYPPYLPFAGGCGLGIKRALFEKIGGFDEALLNCQDTDLCFRVQLAGTPLTFVPDAVVQVRCRSGLWRALQQARRWSMHNVRLAERYRTTSDVPALCSFRTEAARLPRLALKLAHIRRRRDLARWFFELGWTIGMVQESLARKRLPQQHFLAGRRG